MRLGGAANDRKLFCLRHALVAVVVIEAYADEVRLFCQLLWLVGWIDSVHLLIGVSLGVFLFASGAADVSKGRILLEANLTEAGELKECQKGRNDCGQCSG